METRPVENVFNKIRDGVKPKTVKKQKRRLKTPRYSRQRYKTSKGEGGEKEQVMTLDDERARAIFHLRLPTATRRPLRQRVTDVPRLPAAMPAYHHRN
jgi:hypothetical protein